ncbi:MAG: acyl-ACP--UDP-N-acetylglucosamine O-acyltransferase [Verrucomicrobia bacterium]|nr:acyl-ACP--UDP-N-acetylglucosamine O-acyltransferase [Verrucomicrobiota bacterium]
MAVHPTAVVHPKAKVPASVEVGPYSVIGEGVELGEGCVLRHHVSLEGPSRFGKRNLFHPFSSIGGRTQDLKYQGEPTYLEVGDENNFREFVTVNRGTGPGEKTVIGSRNHFLAYVHVAHNCIVGNDCIFSNNGTLAGHVTVGDFAVIGGLSAVHQFCRIGRHAMLGGCTKVVQDVPPYMIADGNPAVVRSVNLTGLQRKGFSEEAIRGLKDALKVLLNPKYNLSQARGYLAEKGPKTAEVAELLEFLGASERGVVLR